MFESVKKNLGELLDAYRNMRYTDAAREVADLAENAADLIRKGADLVDSLLKPLTGAVVAQPEDADAVAGLCADLEAELGKPLVSAPLSVDDAAKLDPATIMLIIQGIRFAVEMFRKWRERRGG